MLLYSCCKTGLVGSWLVLLLFRKEQFRCCVHQVDEGFHTSILPFCIVTVPFARIGTDAREVHEFILMEMPGYLTCWEINEQDVSPFIFPILALMLFDADLVTDRLRVLRYESDTEIAFSIDAIFFFANSLHNLIANPLGIG